MINNIIILLTAIFATIHALIQRQKLTKAEIIDLYLLYFIIGGIGIVGGIGFIGHIFYADKVAQLIGWPVGNPFQQEVGFNDGAWSLLGFLCLFIRGHFWTATIIGCSFFLFGAASIHIQEALVAQNFAPYNAGIILPDLLTPIILLTLLILKYRSAPK